MRKTIGLLLILCGVLSCGNDDTTSPNQNPGAGVILFHSERGAGNNHSEICIMDADGSDQSLLTNSDQSKYRPCWSPDGTKIAFTATSNGNHGVFIMNADGSNHHQIVGYETDGKSPSWSPDGTKLVFCASADLFTVNIDGSNITNITNSIAIAEENPEWSPTGLMIAFDNGDQIFVMNSDGTNSHPISPEGQDAAHPAWSPNGLELAFGMSRPQENTNQICVSNMDGSNLRYITNSPDGCYAPCWSPDGTKLLFEIDPNSSTEIFVINTDGTGLTNLTNNSNIDDGKPAWKPN